MTEAPRVRSFLSGRPAGLPRPRLDEPALEAVLARVLSDCRTAYPEVGVADEPFLRLLAEKVGPAEPLTALAPLATTDLFLAVACAAQDRAGLRIFDQTVLRPAVKVIARVDRTDEFREEVLQYLRERLLVSNPGRRARILEYSARGSLLAWTKVVAVRAAISLRSGRKNRELLIDDPDLEKADTATGVETRIGVRNASAEVVGAMTDALLQLTPEDWLILRQRLSDGRSFEEIAARLGQHRSTVSRKFEAARTLLIHLTKKELRSRLGGSNTSVSHVFRLGRRALEREITGLLRLREEETLP